MRYLPILLLLWHATALAAEPGAQPAAPPPADDGMGGDIGGTASAGVVDWVPVIRSFYINPAAAGQAEVIKMTLKPYDAEGLPSEMLQWEKLKELIERKKDADGRLLPYGPDDPVVVGWKYKLNDDGTTGYEVDAADKDTPIQLLWTSSLLHIWLEVDVLMTTDPKTKGDLLRKHFNFTACEISVWPVGPVGDAKSDAFWKALADPKAPEALRGYRLPVEATAAERKMGITEAKRVILPPVSDEEGHVAGIAGRHEYNVRGAGVWEFRIKLGVSGRVDESERPTIKTVEGTIRTAFTDAKLEVGVLSRAGERKLPTKTKIRP